MIIHLKRFGFICLLICFHGLNCDEVDDYVKLIKQEAEKAKVYQFPGNNEALYPDDIGSNIIDYGRYDFIIVGAGSAGAIVAKRLSDRKFKTLLIEAGNDENAFTDIPGMWRINLSSDFNWGYLTTPQQHICQGMVNKQCSYYVGKALGGTSAINGIIYARGNELDQSFWADFGITGWSWEQVLPYYKKLENYQQIYGDKGYHGYQGPVTIEYTKPPHFMLRFFLQAYEEIGHITEDFNGKDYMAAGQMQYNKINGRRASTNKCYLRNAGRHLSIVTSAFAYKVIFNNTQAVGVEFVKDKVKYRAYSKIEVILSGGVINTPQLLMLSGIGPRQELEKHNIPLIADLPVGQNFQDHFGVTFKFTTNYKPPVTNLDEDVWQYLSGIGRLTAIENVGVAYYSTVNNNTYPDIEILFAGEISPYANGLTEQINSDRHEFTAGILLLHSASRGTITLQSSNPQDYPLIDSMASYNSDDIERLYKGLQHLLKLAETETFTKIDVLLAKEILPACASMVYLSKEFWICTLEQTLIAGMHGVGTCRMGRKGESVVDSRLRVHGIKSLRVVDASVIPRCNSGHSNAVAMMVGEKGAHLIIEDHNK